MSNRLTLTGAILLAGLAAVAHGESKHVLGIHFWDWGANIDVMSHRTGWVVEANVIGGGSMPNVQGRYVPAVAEGFTIVQRLDWAGNFQTMAVDLADQQLFAQQCGNWAGALKDYCRVYSIGNEMEFVDGMTSSIYARGFTMVRDAIKAVQPDAKVAIGHWNNENSARSVARLVGPDGYDGLSAHVGSHIPTGLLGILDSENARPGVGVYITEWGWVADTNTNSMNVMAQFAADLGNWNANHNRQVYCACWYLYPAFLDPAGTFSLELADQYDNAAFENATSLGVALNSYADDAVIMTEAYAEIADSGTSIPVYWKTNVPARTQLWWTLEGRRGWQYERYTPLDKNLTTNHLMTMAGLQAGSMYEVSPQSTADDRGDAGGRRFRVKAGPWSSTATANGPGRAIIHWTTDWPASSRVEYGLTVSLGSSVTQPPLVTDHNVQLGELPPGTIYYRILSSEPNPDLHAPLYMRSPIRSFWMDPRCRGDLDDDGDVDQEDFGFFQACYSGPGMNQNDPACVPALFDADPDVDLSDFSKFQQCFTGPNQPCDPNCGY